MNIAFYLPHGVFGGGERILHTLMDQFSKLGHGAYIYSSNPELNVSQLRYPCRVFTGKKVFQVLPIAKQLKRDSIEVFVCFGNMNQYLIASKLVGVKFLYSLRTDPLQSDWSRPNSRWAVDYSDGAVFQTTKVQSFFTKKVQDKSIVIFNPIMDDLPETSPIRQKKIALIGRLSEEKNQKMALEAFSQIDSKGYTLHIYGQGPLEQELKQLVREKGIEDKVIFEGQVQKVVNHIRDYEIGLLTSNFEGMPNALIEELAMGLACISTDFPSGAATELIQDGINGFVVPMNKPQSMAEKLQELINDDDLRRKMQKNAVGIRNTLDREKIINKWVEYINNIVAK